MMKQDVTPSSPAKLVMVGMLLLWGWLNLSASGLALTVYDETVDLSPDGSAEIHLSLTLPGGAETVLHIPVHHALVTALRQEGTGIVSLSTESRQDVRYLVVDVAPSEAAERTVSLVYRVPDYFALTGKSEFSGDRDLEYRYVNVNFEAIASFSARLILPEGWVFRRFDRFLPKPQKAGTAPPYRLSRGQDRRQVDLSLIEIELGDEVVLACTVQVERRSKTVLVILILVALAYLVFFRDILKAAPKSNGEGA